MFFFSGDGQSLIVSLAESIHVAAKRVGIDKFDALIVDEGQDILNMDALDQLDNYLPDYAPSSADSGVVQIANIQGFSGGSPWLETACSFRRG